MGAAIDTCSNIVPGRNLCKFAFWALGSAFRESAQSQLDTFQTAVVRAFFGGYIWWNSAACQDEAGWELGDSIALLSVGVLSSFAGG